VSNCVCGRGVFSPEWFAAEVCCGATQAGVFKNKEVIQMQSQATYNYKVVRQFAIMTVVWGIVGMLVGVIIAAQLIWPTLTEALGPLAPYLSYGRLRPLHTNAVIFAFGGSALFATSLYVVQRTCQTRLLSDGLAGFVFWGWQLIILLGRSRCRWDSHPRRNMPSWNGPSTFSSPWCGWPTPCCSSAPS